MNEIGRLTPLWAVPRKRKGFRFCTSEMEPFQEAEADQAIKNQEYSYDEVEEPRHDQDQNAGNERHDRRDMGDGQGHLKTLRDVDVGKN